MTTRPTLDSTPEDASLAKWTRDVEGFVEDLIGSANLPSAPAEVKVVSQSNSVKVTFRAVNEVGVSEYKIYRSTDKNFTGENAEHIATVTQAIDPSATDIIYIDAESTEKSYYFVSAVKGLRRPRLEGTPAGFGSATEGHEIGEESGEGGTISGLSGIPGSILFINEDSLVGQDNENFFYSQTFRAMVVGTAGLTWGPHLSPDVYLVRDDSDILALRRGTNNQAFRVYENSAVSGSPDITQSLLTSGNSETNTTVYTTASITPAANKLILAVAVGLRLSNAVNSPPVVTGNGMTWVQVASAPFEHGPGDTDRTNLAVFRALDPAPSSGAVTFTYTDTQARASFSIIEIDNIDIGGADGADAIVQVVLNTESDTATPLVTLSAFSNQANATLGVTAYAVGTPTITPGTGFVEVSEETVAPEGTGHEVEFRSDNDTSVDWVYTSGVRTRSLAIELKNAIAFGGESFVEITGLGSSGGSEVMVDDTTGTGRDLAIGTRTGGGNLGLFNAGIEGARLSPTAFALGLNNLAFGSALGTEDTILVRDGAADTLAQRRGTNIQTFRVYETLVGSPAPITQTVLLADGDASDLTVYTTASINPTANKLVICMVMAADFGFSNTIHVDSVTGAGLTWVEMVDLNFDTIASGRRCLAIYRALGPSPSAGALTITLDTPGTACRWIIVEFDNIDTSGTNGSGAIVQNATNRADSGTSIIATLAAFSSSDNATIGCFGSGSVSTNLTEGSGFAKIAEVDLGTIKAMFTFRNDNDTTVDMSQSVDGDMAVVAFEIKNSGITPGRYIEVIGLGASGGAEVMAVTGSGGTERELIIGTRGNEDVVVHANDLEVARFGIDGSLSLTAVTFGGTQIRTVSDTVVTSSGSSVTSSNLIPAGSFVIGITTRVTTLVTGPAGYDVGDGTDVDRWGNSILVAEDTTSDITDFQSSALTLFPAANDVVITSDGIDFTAGEILITVHYMTLVAPTA